MLTWLKTAFVALAFSLSAAGCSHDRHYDHDSHYDHDWHHPRARHHDHHWRHSEPIGRHHDYHGRGDRFEHRSPSRGDYHHDHHRGRH